ncbi:esterase family protein [Phycicoccus sp. Root563]|uniref:alpha/beta hydrolase n=1 Tax=Phycicoccus sp. Root563 TaxID=1736562 RepID=UPI0009EB7652|nr:alpha/beta hydrolase-fold protein [Phycicoccus sp. Root563]
MHAPRVGESAVSLTSTTLPVVLALAAAAVFALLASGRPRVRRPWAATGARAAGLLVLNVLVVALVGAELNDHFDFYVSWSDLAGAQAATTVTHHGATARSAASTRLPSGLRPATSLPALPSPGERVQHYTVTGARSGVRGQVDVLLPAGYSTATATSYPVLEALHGYPGTTDSWLTGMGVEGALDRAVADHSIKDAVVVLPQINLPYAVDSECVDGPAGTSQVETWLAQDVPQFVVDHFRVRTDRSSWAVAGYSEGGWCAAMLGLRHPAVFGGDIVFSGSFTPEFSRGYRPFGSRVPGRYQLAAVVRRDPPPLAMWVQASKKDGYAYPPTAAFLKSVRAPLSVTTDLLKTGGHREQLWAGELPTALSWLGRSVPGFSP